MFVGTICFSYSVPHSVTLTLVGGQEVSTKQACLLRFLFFFFSSDQDQIWYNVETIPIEHPDTAFEWDVMIQKKYLLIYWMYQEQKFNTGMHFEVFE